MNAPWPVRKLCSIADIRVSNVDKKTHASEKPVKLCNYLDVYSNEYVTGGLDFMEASASIAEIERFGLRLGDVVITKDSETPDDIGIPAVIAESIDRLVCGYHLALIRPRADQLDSVYLAKQLSTSRVARYFALHASGSTRYGLPKSVIESVSIPTPPKPEQTKIAEILSTVDRAIEQTEALIAKQQLIKTGQMQDLLTRGIDEHGNLRSEQTHAFKDSALGRIPVEWEVKPVEQLMDERIISDVQDGNHGELHPKSRDFVDEGIPFIMASDIADGCIGVARAKKITERQYRRLRIGFSKPGDVLLSHKASIGFVALVPENLSAIMLTPQVTYYRIGRRDTLDPRYLAQFFRSTGSQGELKGLAKQSTRDYIGILAQRKLHIAYPMHLIEQELIYSLLDLQDVRMLDLQKLLNKFRSLKTALLQDLLTGKKRVTHLLEPETTH